MSDELELGAGVPGPACDKQVGDYSLFTPIAVVMGPVSYTQGFTMRLMLPAFWHRTYLANFPRFMLSKGIWLAYYEGACLGPRSGWRVMSQC